MQTLQPNVVNVSTVVGEAKLRAFHLRVVALCGMLIFFDGFDLQAVSYAAPSIAAALHLTRPQLGPVFSAGLLGLTGGALLFGYLGDRLGRKRVFIACGLLFGLASIATTTANSLGTLLMWRVLAGLALGGATPLSITIATDSCPRRLRATLTMIMYTGFTLGGVFGGFVYARLPAGRWDLLFLIGGALPILLAPVLMAWLPESLDYLVLRGAPAARITRILDQQAPGRSWVGATFITDSPPPGGFEIAQLFADGRALMTALLWAIFFVSLIGLFFLTTWLPTLLNSDGLSPDQIVSVSFALQGGGLIGSLILARVLATTRPFVTIAVSYVLAAVLMLALSRVGQAGLGVLIGTTLLLGVFLVGSQNGLNAMSAQLYPASLRSTGVGWGIGIGRIGAVIGPSLAGYLVSLSWTPSELLALAAIPPFGAGLIALAIAAVTRGRAPE